MRFVSKGRIYNTHVYCGFLSDGVVYQEVRKPLCFAEFIGPTMRDHYDSSSDFHELISKFATALQYRSFEVYSLFYPVTAIFIYVVSSKVYHNHSIRPKYAVDAVHFK